MKTNADGKSMHVTVTINGKKVDERVGKDAGEMEWQRTDSDEASKSGTADAPKSGEQVKVFRLQNASADECAAHLIALKFNARIRADTRTNSVFVISADVEQLSKIEAILL